MSAADLAAGDRLEAAFAREERRGLMVATTARSASVVVILGWLAVANPERGAAYAWVLGTAAFFLVICLPGARLVDYLIKRNQGKTARGAQHIEVA